MRFRRPDDPRFTIGVPFDPPRTYHRRASVSQRLSDSLFTASPTDANGQDLFTEKERRGPLLSLFR